jgi:hypothetical protein
MLIIHINEDTDKLAELEIIWKEKRL